MSKGRNTSVVSVRLPDDEVKRINALSRKYRLTRSELLKSIIENTKDKEREQIKYELPKYGGDNIEEMESEEAKKIDEEKKECEHCGQKHSRFKALPSVETRNKAKAKKKKRKKKK